MSFEELYNSGNYYACVSDGRCPSRILYAILVKDGIYENYKKQARRLLKRKEHFEEERSILKTLITQAKYLREDEFEKLANLYEILGSLDIVNQKFKYHILIIKYGKDEENWNDRQIDYDYNCFLDDVLFERIKV